LALRNVIEIDQEKCDGCGLCILACAEGAIQLVNGKAVLISDKYCDGLGACLGDCPQDAITIIEREALDYNEKAVENHLRTNDPRPSVEKKLAQKSGILDSSRPVVTPLQSIHTGGVCPGSMSRSFDVPEKAPASKEPGVSSSMMSQLTNWPVQLMLAPTSAPYFENADLLIAADCVPFAYPNFHNDFLAGRTLLIACPKLDKVDIYLDKLTEIFRRNEINSIGIAFMEVPCCNGLVQLARTALEQAGKNIPLNLTRLGVRGGVLTRQQIGGEENGS